jgi:hypothetical protein
MFQTANVKNPIKNPFQCLPMNWQIASSTLFLFMRVTAVAMVFIGFILPNANDLFVFINFRAFVWQGQPLTPAYWLRIALPPFKDLFSTLNTVNFLLALGSPLTACSPLLPLSAFPASAC